MKQRITMTIETTIPTHEDEISKAVEQLGIKVISCIVGKPYDRRPGRDGEK